MIELVINSIALVFLGLEFLFALSAVRAFKNFERSE
jgi:hypothetical protein